MKNNVPLSFKYPVVTEQDILEKVCKDMGISRSIGKFLYKAFVGFLKYRIKEHGDLSFRFKRIGTFYYNYNTGKEYNRSKQRTARRKLFENRIGLMFRDYPSRVVGHTNNKRIYKFYGVGRWNHSTKRKYTCKEICERQNNVFKEENYEKANKVQIGPNSGGEVTKVWGEE